MRQRDFQCHCRICGKKVGAYHGLDDRITDRKDNRFNNGIPMDKRINISYVCPDPQPGVPSECNIKNQLVLANEQRKRLEQAVWKQHNRDSLRKVIST